MLFNTDQVTDAKDTSWNIWWCERSEVRNVLDLKLDSRQKIPHFRNHHELTRKDYLSRNLKRFRNLLRKSGKPDEAELANSMPITFELPNEYRMLVETYNRQGGGTWIVKPAAGSQGRGIFLFRKLKDLADWRSKETTAGQANDDSDVNTSESYVVQKYLEDPYLLAGTYLSNTETKQIKLPSQNYHFWHDIDEPFFIKYERTPPFMNTWIPVGVAGRRPGCLCDLIKSQISSKIEKSRNPGIHERA